MDEFDFGESIYEEEEEESAASSSRSSGINLLGGDVRSSKDPEVLTITELTRKVRNLLELNLGEVWVEGEVSNFRLQTSGHQYFTLKDKKAQLSCVFFRGNAQFSQLQIKDGMQLQVFGEITVYEARGQYQMIVRRVQKTGLGDLQAKFEELKTKLNNEGIFRQEHKLPIKAYPETIALITSPTGAALRDIINILSRRAPWVRVLIYPVRVQGDGAFREIINGLDFLSDPHPGMPRIDTIVLTRGGGSIEDLWNFNEEELARAVFKCPVPIISAVGHEIDFTICDFVSDLRAPTPSAAAELVVPDREELRRRILNSRQGMARRVKGVLDHWAKVTQLYSRGTLFREPQRLLQEYLLEVDAVRESLNSGIEERLRNAAEQLQSSRHKLDLLRPDRVLERRLSEIKLLREKLQKLISRQLEERVQQLARNRSVLKSLGPESVLSRGFSITTDSDGKVLSDAGEVGVGTNLITRLAAGKLYSKTTEPPTGT